MFLDRTPFSSLRNRRRMATGAVVTGLATVAIAGAEDAHHTGHATHHAAMPMSAEDMDRWVTAWYAEHPPRGEFSGGAPVDTFSVFSFGFDNDGVSDGVDTAFVFTGQTVLWQRSDGTHTVTSGTGAFNPGAGDLFDQPINSTNQTFAFEFTTTGTVPFFCRPHEGLMRGVVVVATPTDVIPISDRLVRSGFAADPAPNPTRDDATFRFALGRNGRVQAEVYDVGGRRVAVVVDRMLDPGTYAARWDGRTGRGERASAGVYYLRLTVPGASETREIVLTR